VVLGRGAVLPVAPVPELPEVEEDAGAVEPGVEGVVVRGEVDPVVFEGSPLTVVLSASAVVAVEREVSATLGPCPGAPT
jgi:hypothetical protein